MQLSPVDLDLGQLARRGCNAWSRALPNPSERTALFPGPAAVWVGRWVSLGAVPLAYGPSWCGPSGVCRAGRCGATGGLRIATPSNHTARRRRPSESPPLTPRVVPAARNTTRVVPRHTLGAVPRPTGQPTPRTPCAMNSRPRHRSGRETRRRDGNPPNSPHTHRASSLLPIRNTPRPRRADPPRTSPATETPRTAPLFPACTRDEKTGQITQRTAARSRQVA